jgi:hypothetical protein
LVTVERPSPVRSVSSTGVRLELSTIVSRNFLAALDLSVVLVTVLPLSGC